MTNKTITEQLTYRIVNEILAEATDDNPFDNPPDPNNPMQPSFPEFDDEVGPFQKPGVRTPQPFPGLPGDPPPPVDWDPWTQPPRHVKPLLPNGDPHPLWRDWEDINPNRPGGPNVDDYGQPHWRQREKIRGWNRGVPGTHGYHWGIDPGPWRPGGPGRPDVPLWPLDPRNPDRIPPSMRPDFPTLPGPKPHVPPTIQPDLPWRAPPVTPGPGDVVPTPKPRIPWLPRWIRPFVR